MMLIREECFKFFANKKNVLLIALTAILMAALCLVMQTKHNSYLVSEEEKYASAVKLAESNIVIIVLDDRRGLEPLNQDKLTFWETESKLSQELKINYNFYDAGNWRKLLQTKIQRNTNLIHGYENGYLRHSMYSKEEMLNTLRQENLLYQYFLDHNQVPYASPYELTASNFLRFLLDNVSPLLLMIIMSIFFLDLCAGEFEDGSYKMLYTLPHPRKNIYKAKIFAGMLCSLGSIILILIAFTIGITLFKGFGQLNYPMAIASGNTSVITSLGTYLIHGYGMLFGLLILSGSVIYFMSLLLNSVSTTVSVTISLFMISYAIASFFNHKIFHILWPFADYLIERRISAYGYPISYITIAISLLASMILLIIGSNILDRRDLVGGKEA